MSDSLDTMLFFAPVSTLAVFVIGLIIGVFIGWLLSNFKLVKRGESP